MKIHLVCLIFLATATAALAWQADSDGDGLADQAELELGTDPFDVDTDCDAVSDGLEVGEDALSPRDSDNDGWIDALESNIVDANGDGRPNFDDETRGVQFTCGVFHPFAIANDLSESTRLEVHLLSDTPVEAVFAASSEMFADVFVDGESAGQGGIQLFDDGTRGDRRAGDSIFTREGITTNAIDPNGRRLIDRDFDLLRVVTFEGDVEIRLDERSSFNLFRLGVVSVVNPEGEPALLEDPVLVAEGVQRVSHLANMVDPQSLLEVKRFLDVLPRDLQPLIRRFYTHFADEYDTLFLFPDSPSMQAAFGISRRLQNLIEGIGGPLFDATSRYGTAGRLKSVVARNFQRNGPTLHEFAHQWGVRLDESFGFGGAHWGWSGSGRGQLGGFDPDTLRINSDGSFSVGGFGFSANGGDTPLFSFIELYLMGLAAPEEVPDIPVMVDPRILFCSPPRDCFRGTIIFEASGMHRWSIEDIIEVHGPRRPPVGEAPDAFATAFVVVSQRPLNASELAYFNIQAEIFGAEEGEGRINSFQEGTRGRAIMDTAIRLKRDLNRLEFPLLRENPVEFTGYALLNHSGQPAELEIFGYNDFGWLAAREFLEMDVPVRVTLRPGEQIARRALELLGAGAGDRAFRGWLRVFTDNPGVSGFVQSGTSALTRLDGGVPSAGGSRKLVFQRVFDSEAALREGEARTTLDLVNPGPFPAEIKLTLVRNGEEDLVSDTSISPRDFNLQFRVARDHFGVAVPDDGYIVLESLNRQPVIGLARIDSLEEETSIFLSADEGEPGPEQILYSSQFAFNEQLFTNLKLINRSESARQVTLRAIGNDGRDLADTQEVTLAAGEQFTADASQLFPLPEGGFEGSLEAQSDGPGIIGSVVFGDRVGHRFAAALPLQAQRFREAVFGHVASVGDFFTGLAFFNPDTLAAQLEIEVFRPDGSLVGRTETQLLPGERRSRLAREWVPAAEGQAGGYVRVRSTRPLVAQMLFGRTRNGDGTLELLSAALPTPTGDGR